MLLCQNWCLNECDCQFHICLYIFYQQLIAHLVVGVGWCFFFKLDWNEIWHNCSSKYASRFPLVMGDSAKKKMIRFSATNESIWFNSIRFNLIRFTVLSEPPRQSTPGVLDSAGPVHRRHDWLACIATELLIAFEEASGNIDANVSHDAILQHSDARS